MIKNNRGFTFVEILAVVAIMGILSGIAIAGVTRYREKQVQNNYDSIATSSYNAYESYMMKNGSIDSISINELKEGDFISNIQDPKNKNNDCTGNVFRSNDNKKIYVTLCCSNYKEKYSFYGQELIEEKNEFQSGTHTKIDNCEVDETYEKEPTIHINEQKDNETYEIKYVCAGVNNNPSNQIKQKDKTIKLSENIPNKKNYSFKNWTGNNGKIYNPGEEYIENKPLTLTCNMIKDNIEIKFKVSSQEKTYNTKQIKYDLEAKSSISNITKYCITKNQEECTPNIKYNNVIKDKLYEVAKSYDGKKYNLKVCVLTTEGNSSCSNNKTYEVYNQCSETKNNGNTYCGTYGSCSTKCNPGTKTAPKYQDKKDKYLKNVTCPKEILKEKCNTTCNNTKETACTKYTVLNKFDNPKTSCNSNPPKRTYDFSQYMCTCKYSKTTGEYTGYEVKDVTDIKKYLTIYGNKNDNTSHLAKEEYFLGHEKSHQVIIKYQNNTNGKKACQNLKGYPVNSYIKQMCDNGNATKDGLEYHGYVIYSKAANQKHTTPQYTKYWMHGLDKPKAKDKEKAIERDDAKNEKIACEKTCKLLWPNAYTN